MDDFDVWYAATRDRVFRSLLAITRNREDAAEIAAEAFTRACDRWTSVRRHPNPTAWVMRVALNVHRSRWRRRRRELPDPPDLPVDADEPFDPQLRSLVLALPRRQREVVALRVLADLSAQSTAVLGIAPGTVGVHLARALGTLRDQLSVGVPPTMNEVPR